MSRHGRWTPAGVLLGCALLAVASLAFSAMPHYDAWGWIVWGRELTSGPAHLVTLGGPAWKPLPVLFTTPAALLGSAAPAAWLVVVRTGGELALVLAFVLGRRLAGRWAGALAVLALALSSGWLVDLAWGACDPLLVAALLGGVLLHLDGRHERALVAGLAAALVRPEAWPFLGLYALWAWRRGGARGWVVSSVLLAVPVLWLGPDWYSTGDPFTGGRAARGSVEAELMRHAKDPAGLALSRIAGLEPLPVWVAALGAAVVAVRRRERAVVVLALAAASWVAVVVVMAVAGYAGLARFALAAAGLASVLAGVGVVRLLGGVRTPRSAIGLGLAAAALCVPSVLMAVRSAARDARESSGGRPVMGSLREAIDRAGGSERVLAMGVPTGNGPLLTALAWQLDVPLNRVVQGPETGPYVVFRARPSHYAGVPPAWRTAGGRRRRVAEAGAWEVVRVAPAPPARPPGGTRGHNDAHAASANKHTPGHRSHAGGAGGGRTLRGRGGAGRGARRSPRAPRDGGRLAGARLTPLSS